LAFDYDGTLAPIVRDPAKARMRARTKKALEQVAQRYPTAVISGRGRGDVAAMLEGLSLVAVLGSHGIEPAKGIERFEMAVRNWTGPLQETLQHVPGVEIENTRYSLAIHYRKSGNQRAAARAIREAIERCITGARVVGGKCVVNVIPPGAPHKGSALKRLREKTRTETALYIGDDWTDEDVFALDRSCRILGIRVGRGAQSRAPYYLRDQSEVDLLLSHLARLRSTSS
jgi:trehalose 6-phosphate phosphatase